MEWVPILGLATGLIGMVLIVVEAVRNAYRK